MGIETYKCHCGNEFEDSEFSVMDECAECRANYATAPPDIHDIYRQYFTVGTNTAGTTGIVWNDGPPMFRFTQAADPWPTARIGDTITIRRPARLTADDDLPF